MTNRFEWIQQEIDGLKSAGLYNRIRTLGSPQGAWLEVDGKHVLNFCSNNYLGLANHPALVRAAQESAARYGVGPAAVRSIAGTMDLHLELERRLAAFKGVESAITFQSGFTANLAVIPALVGKEDVILSDELNHASIIDGSRLSGARIVRFAHANPADLERVIQENAGSYRRALIITDGVFSMDGDIAPLDQICAIANAHDILLMVDDAHGEGVLGRGGRGIVDHFHLHGKVDIEVGTLSKAFGVVGGVVARCVVNAAGVWVDDVRGMDEPGVDHLLSPSQGAHVVVDRDVFPSASALLVPRTADGRVLFAVPWHGKVILGTTDTPRSDLPREPRPFAAEVNFILTEAARYLQHPPTREDVRSAWAGLRPLVKPAAGGRETRRISREHACVVSPRGLVTVTGGKWTTYRAMAEDVLARCFAAGILPARPAGVTRTLRLVGAPDIGGVGMSAVPGLHLYGTEADAVAALPGADEEILPGLTAAMVRFAARREYARTVADVLARRSRWLFLDAARATDAAARVAAILADERGGTFDAAAAVAEFRRLAAGYVLPP